MRDKGIARRIQSAVGLAASAALVAMGLVVLPIAVETASAADNGSFDAGFIISDEVFFNSSAMTTSQIQSFLHAKDSDCTPYTSGSTKYYCMDSFKGTSTTRGANNNCTSIGGKSGETAASMIYRVARACGINPQVLLVSLQKEQGLITAGPKSSSVFKIAMGYGCPDTAACNTKYYGLFNQLYSAAWQFQEYKRTPLSYRHHVGTIAVRYHPNASCGSSNVYIRNQATAGLYNYTPYQPNQAALDAGSGIGNSCSTYGNRNFWRYFTDWFGNPANLLKTGGFDATSSSAWATQTGNISRKLHKGASDAQSGTAYIELDTTKAGSSISNRTTRDMKVGDAYEAIAWVRAAADADTTNGRLVIWGLGGTTESVTEEFTVTSGEWTRISTMLEAAHGHTSMRVQVYLDSPGHPLELDSASLARIDVPLSRAPIALVQPSFEKSSSGKWKSGSGPKVSIKRVKATAEIPAQDGNYSLAATTATSGASFNQDVARKTSIGESYTASAWVRVGAGADQITGQFAIAGLGGRNESSRTRFTATSEWQQVTATIAMSATAHTKLRVAVYLGSAQSQLLIDNVTLTPNLAVNPSFENKSGSGWFTSSGAVTTMSYTDPIDSSNNEGAPVGKYYIGVQRSGTAGTRWATDITRPLTVGDTYTFGAWVKSGSPTETYTSNLRLVARGGNDDAEYTVTNFIVGQEWTWVEVSHTVTTPQTTLRAEIQASSMPFELMVDGVQVY